MICHEGCDGKAMTSDVLVVGAVGMLVRMAGDAGG